jgi:photosystem II stability/assembly factor-like uncharacterized protein
VRNRHFFIYLNLLLRTVIIILLFSFSFLLSEAATHDWIDTSPGLSGKYASALAINPKNYHVVYVAMYEGGVFKSNDAGQTWLPINNGLNTPEDRQIISLTLDPVNPKILYAGTNTAKVYRTLNEGESWQLINQGIHAGTVIYCRIFSLQIDPTNSSHLYAATSTGIYHSKDQGNSWSRIGYRDTGLENTFNMGIAIDYANPHILYAASQKGVFKSTDHGESWLAIGPEDGYIQCLVIDPANSNRIYSGTNKGLLISSDGGKSWREGSLKSERTNNPLSVKSLIINPSHPQEIYAATGVGIYHSSDRGEKWEEIKPQKRLLFWTSNDLAIDFSDSLSIYSAANGLRDKPGGFVWKYTF